MQTIWLSNKILNINTPLLYLGDKKFIDWLGNTKINAAKIKVKVKIKKVVWCNSLFNFLSLFSFSNLTSLGMLIANVLTDKTLKKIDILKQNAKIPTANMFPLKLRIQTPTESYKLNKITRRKKGKDFLNKAFIEK
jgi:hypothetical protein